ncbi:MAG: hypothetical protein ACQ9ET_05745 [Nitrosomonadaceae bacterium]
MAVLDNPIAGRGTSVVALHSPPSLIDVCYFKNTNQHRGYSDE